MIAPPSPGKAELRAPRPHCERSFADANGCWQHIKATHGKKAAREFRAAHMPRQDAEMSMGQQLVDALDAARCGEPVPEHIALMFPDEVRRARLQIEGRDHG